LIRFSTLDNEEEVQQEVLTAAIPSASELENVQNPSDSQFEEEPAEVFHLQQITCAHKNCKSKDEKKYEF
jgi:hypothetical protein